MLVTISDIRPLKRAEESVRRMRDHLLKIIEASPDYILTANRDHSIAFFGSRWLELTALSESQLPGYDFFNLLPENILASLEGGWEIALKGKATSFETTIRRADQTAIPVIISFIPFELEGQILVSVRDVSEERRIHEQLMQSEKLAALGEIMAGVAHEINNPLGAVIGFSEMLMESPTLDAQSRDFAKKVRESGNRVHRIV
ncbi:MAG: histidine kinase dimerization/phospho-acceptor domain-containing protein, partial [bacterium]